MADQSQFVIRVQSSEADAPLSPNSMSAKEHLELMAVIVGFLDAATRGASEKAITLFEDGSVIAVTQVDSKTARAIDEVLRLGSQDDRQLPRSTRSALDGLRKYGRERRRKCVANTNLPNSAKLEYDPETDVSSQSDDVWFEGETEWIGEIVDAGGSGKPNIHLKRRDDSGGIIVIRTDREVLENMTENILYKTFIVRVSGLFNMKTRDPYPESHPQLVELRQTSDTLDSEYLTQLRNKAKSWVSDLDVDTWMNELRKEIDG